MNIPNVLTLKRVAFIDEHPTLIDRTLLYLLKIRFYFLQLRLDIIFVQHGQAKFLTGHLSSQVPAHFFVHIALTFLIVDWVSVKVSTAIDWCSKLSHDLDSHVLLGSL